MNAMHDTIKLDFLSTLRHVSDRELKFLSSAPIPFGTTEISLADEKVSVSYPGKLLMEEATVVSEIWVGDHVMEIYAPMRAINALVKAFGFSQDMTGLSSDVRAIALEHILKDLAQVWERGFDGTFEVMSVLENTVTEYAAELFLDVHGLTDRPFSLAIMTDQATLKRMPSFEPTDVHTLADAINIDLMFMSEPFMIDSAELSELERGGGFLLPKNWNPETIFSVQIGDLALAYVTDDDDQLSVDTITPLAEIRNNNLSSKGTHMSDLSQFDIEIGIEIARETIPLNKLQGLVEGDVLPLPGLMSPTVTLRANGREVAKGELISTESGYAVQIIELR